MIKPITDEQLAQLDEWYKGYPSGDTAEPKQDFDSEVGMLYGAIRERIRLAEAVVEAASTNACRHPQGDRTCSTCEAINAYLAATEVKP